jgi:hypothetical protein
MSGLDSLGNKELEAIAAALADPAVPSQDQISLGRK